MVPLARRLLWDQKGRSAITVGGVAFVNVLVLFLFGVYFGVAQGSTAYVRSSSADVWVSMRNSTNLLRSSSFLRASALEPLRHIDGVDDVSGLLRLIATADVRGAPATLFIFGFDAASPMARPPIVEGTAQIAQGDIVLDRAFAATHDLAVGDSLTVQDHSFRVRGLSGGTNAMVAQFSFMTLADAQRLLGFPGVVSFGVLGLRPEAQRDSVVAAVTARDPRLAAFAKETFVSNNLREMETGILPVLWAIAFFGAVTGTTVLALLLYGSVQERREDYAVLSAVGAPHRYLQRLVLRQSLFVGIVGFTLSVVLYLACTPGLRHLVPSLELVLPAQALVLTFVLTLGISVIGSWAALHKLRGIYPAEVFRA